MKRSIIATIASLALTAGVVIYCKNNPSEKLSALYLNNIEALSRGEARDGYKPDFTKYKMCGEYMYNPCVPGRPSDTCSTPC